MTHINDYYLFEQFIETYIPAGFKNINTNDSLILEIEKMLEANDQIFFIGDLILFKMLYISDRVAKKIGVKPEFIDPGFFITTTHPDDLRRHNQARTKHMSLALELYIKKEGMGFVSLDLRTKKPGSGYYHMLYQWYYFYSNVPSDTVYLLVVITDISKFKKSKVGTHYYFGNNLTHFRYPDEELLGIGNIFSDREFEIIQQIELGLSTSQIASKFNRSKHTIETHRSNIITKSGKNTIMEVIYDLKQKGLL